MPQSFYLFNLTERAYILDTVRRGHLTKGEKNKETIFTRHLRFVGDHL